MKPCLALTALILFSSASAAASAKPQTLWQEWYLITQNGTALGYFEETAEKRPADQQIAVTQKWVEKSGSGKSDTYIGSVAEDKNLTPVAFFVDRKGEKIYKIDGRVKNKKLEITFKPASAGQQKTTEFTPLRPDMFLSSFASMAMARHFKDGGAVQFVAVVEDDGEMNVTVKKAMAEIKKSTKKIGRESCREVHIKFDGKPQEWWISDQGKACLVNFPDSGIRMELSSETLAKKALETP